MMRRRDPQRRRPGPDDQADVRRRRPQRRPRRPPRPRNHPRALTAAQPSAPGASPSTSRWRTSSPD